MSDGYPLPDLMDGFTERDRERIRVHDLPAPDDIRDARESVRDELARQFGDGDIGSDEEFYNLTEWRDGVEFDTRTLEHAIHFLREIDGFPIMEGPTAFVGWYERWPGDRVEDADE